MPRTQFLHYDASAIRNRCRINGFKISRRTAKKIAHVIYLYGN